METNIETGKVTLFQKLRFYFSFRVEMLYLNGRQISGHWRVWLRTPLFGIAYSHGYVDPYSTCLENRLWFGVIPRLKLELGNTLYYYNLSSNQKRVGFIEDYE